MKQSLNATAAMVLPLLAACACAQDRPGKDAAMPAVNERVAELRAKFDHPKADAALSEYDRHAGELRSKLDGEKPDLADEEWVKKKLAVMAKLDQYAFRFRNPFAPGTPEADYFDQNMRRRVAAVTEGNLADLKKLTAVYLQRRNF